MRENAKQLQSRWTPVQGWFNKVRKVDFSSFPLKANRRWLLSTGHSSWFHCGCDCFELERWMPSVLCFRVWHFLIVHSHTGSWSSSCDKPSEWGGGIDSYRSILFPVDTSTETVPQTVRIQDSEWGLPSPISEWNWRWNYFGGICNILEFLVVLPSAEFCLE